LALAAAALPACPPVPGDLDGERLERGDDGDTPHLEDPLDEPAQLLPEALDEDGEDPDIDVTGSGEDVESLCPDACDDGDPCTTLDRCHGGACRGSPLSCDDGNTCTTDRYEDGTCHHLPVSGPCDDGDACTTGDTCVGLVCQGAPRIYPESACAKATCDPRTGCGLAFIAGPCDDGDACTEYDVCRAGTCAGPLARCDDGNPCTDDYCDRQGRPR
jgi:hypothetical protein